MKKLFIFLFAAMFIFYVGCDEDNGGSNPDDNSDIPADPSGVNMPTPTINNVQPTGSFSKTAGNPNRVIINMTGMLNPATGNPIELTYLQSLYVSEDNVVQGLKVEKVGTGNQLMADIVFTIDISGSMGEESDSVAASIIEFANTLSQSGLQVQFGCVGYYGNVRGAINFTDATTLENYLNRTTGTSRAQGFSGPDSAALENKSYTFASETGSSDENGVVGIFFADSMFNWRAGAQRIFVNFTDESTQPDGQAQWGSANCCNLISQKATIHTVWSGGDTATAYSWQELYDERPWRLSECSGGTFIEVPYNATGLNLSQLPVTGALTNSYKVEFISADGNVAHNVVITVITSTADGKKEYTALMY